MSQLKPLAEVIADALARGGHFSYDCIDITGPEVKWLVKSVQDDVVADIHSSLIFNLTEIDKSEGAYRINLAPDHEDSNVTLNEGFTQVCVWPGTVVLNCDDAEHTTKDFEDWIMKEFKSRAQYLEEIKTGPTPGEEGTGNRNDLFFAVHTEDLGKFAVPRLKYGIRWIEDVYGNDGGYLYPERVAKYQSWNAK